MSEIPTYDELLEKIRALEEALRLSTEREATLRVDQENYRFLTEHMRDVLWTLDMNMMPTYISPGSQKILGFSPEERMIQHLSDMVTPDTYAVTMECLARELEKDAEPGANPDRTITLEMEHYHKDGHTVWIEDIIGAIRDAKGRIIGLHGVSRDISERKRVEQELRESRELYAKLVDAMQDIVIGGNLEGTILFVNAYALQIGGYQRDELLGRKIYDFASPKDRDRMIRDLAEAANGDLSLREYLMLTKDGREIPFEINGNLLRREDATPYGFVSVSRDIRERRQAEQERERLIAELQQALSEVKTLSGLLPICASCKKIRDDRGYWNSIEDYIEKRSDAQFTHGICPECTRKLYPQHTPKTQMEK